MTIIKKQQLYRADPTALKRLAAALRLHTDGMSHRQIARLVFWLLTRKNKWRRLRLGFYE